MLATYVCNHMYDLYNNAYTFIHSSSTYDVCTYVCVYIIIVVVYSICSYMHVIIKYNMYTYLQYVYGITGKRVYIVWVWNLLFILLTVCTCPIPDGARGFGDFR